MLHRRRMYFVKKKLQFKYLLFVFFAMIVPTLICGGALYYIIWQAVAAEVGIPEAIAEVLMPALTRVNMMLLIALPLVFLVMLLLSLSISHRIAGPIYRLEKELKEIVNGDYSRRIQFRSDDEFHEIAESINKVLDHFTAAKGKA